MKAGAWGERKVGTRGDVAEMSLPGLTGSRVGHRCLSLPGLTGSRIDTDVCSIPVSELGRERAGCWGS